MLKKNLFGDTEAYLIFDDTVISKKYGHKIDSVAPLKEAIANAKLR